MNIIVFRYAQTLFLIIYQWAGAAGTEFHILQNNAEIVQQRI